jgi:hypothetical protein
MAVAQTTPFPSANPAASRMLSALEFSFVSILFGYGIITKAHLV